MCIRDRLNNVSSVITNALNRLSEYSQGTSVTVQGLSAMMPYVRQLFDNSVSGWEDTAPEDIQAQINAIRTQLDTITADLTALENNADTSMETVRNLSNKIVTEIANCQKAVDGLRNDFAYNVKPKLENTMSSMQQSMIAAAGILDGVDADFNGVENALSDYQSTLERGSSSLGGSLSMAQELLAKLNSCLLYTSSPNIDSNDLNTKMNAAKKILSKGDKVKITLRFRGREMAHMNASKHILDDFAASLGEIAVVEKAPKVEGRSISMVLAEKKS